MKRLLAAVLAVATLVACEESIKNGIIPDKYIPTAQKYTGNFRGEFDGRTVDLNFSIDANGYARLTAQTADDRQELVNGCPTPIGKVIGVNGDEKKQKIKYARFDFNGRRCNLPGYDLVVYVDNENQLTVQLPESSHWEYDQPHCYPNPPYGQYCDQPQPPHEEVIDHWMTGTFHRL